MDGQRTPQHRRTMSALSPSLSGKKKGPDSVCSEPGRRLSMSRSLTMNGERTVKRLRLSKALTMPESTTVLEACRRMAARRVNAALLTDSNALLCGILTDKDIARRVVACELVLEETPVSKVMTRNPVFVLSDTLAEEALQKMVLGKFRHLPVVENGEVIALLDIAKCLYDAIARMERASEKGKAIQAAIEGVEKHLGTSMSGSNQFIETLKEQVFRPSLSTIITENIKVVTVSPNDSVLLATKKMVEVQRSSAVVADGNKPLGILTSKDILMRVVAKDLSPESTTVEKVMTRNPECGTIDTSILDALRIMQAGKFLHLPVLDRDGSIFSMVDVLHITCAAVSTVENTGAIGNEAAISVMQKFWDSALAIMPTEDDDETRSNLSAKIQSEMQDTMGSPYPSSSSILTDMFSFKLEDRNGRMHRFNCETRSLTKLITCILQRVGNDIDRQNLPTILYEDDDQDKVILASDSDLTAAVEHARLAGWKGLKIFLDSSGEGDRKKGRGSASPDYASIDRKWSAAYSAVAAGAAVVAGIGVVAYLRRTSS